MPAFKNQMKKSIEVVRAHKFDFMFNMHNYLITIN